MKNKKAEARTMREVLGDRAKKGPLNFVLLEIVQAIQN